MDEKKRTNIKGNQRTNGSKTGRNGNEIGIQKKYLLEDCEKG
jgi:hypothetical protein